jgi:uncharacterized protein YprB with RNaseH-like and TPR domain
MNKKENLEEFLKLYKTGEKITDIARNYCVKNDITYTENERKKISKWINGSLETQVKTASKILFYDIETTKLLADVWWTGKQYVSHASLRTETKIISISYKWLGSEKVECITWDNDKKCDKELIEKFLKIYNEANFVVGINNDNFDNRLVNVRGFKYQLDVNTHVRSLDLQREAKRLFRLPSYSMAYIAKYLGLEGKYNHAGGSMWEDIQYGVKEKSEKALKEMVKYNDQDVLTTEQLYFHMRKYIKTIMHIGVLNNTQKYCCPTCGSDKVSLYKTTVTPAGTIQHIMQCEKDEIKYKINNSTYLKFINDKR